MAVGRFEAALDGLTDMETDFTPGEWATIWEALQAFGYDLTPETVQQIRELFQDNPQIRREVIYRNPPYRTLPRIGGGVCARMNRQGPGDCAWQGDAEITCRLLYGVRERDETISGADERTAWTGVPETGQLANAAYAEALDIMGAEYVLSMNFGESTFLPPEAFVENAVLMGLEGWVLAYFGYMHDLSTSYLMSLHRHFTSPPLYVDGENVGGLGWPANYWMTIHLRLPAWAPAWAPGGRAFPVLSKPLDQYVADNDYHRIMHRILFDNSSFRFPFPRLEKAFNEYDASDYWKAAHLVIHPVDSYDLFYDLQEAGLAVSLHVYFPELSRPFHQNLFWMSRCVWEYRRKLRYGDPNIKARVFIAGLYMRGPVERYYGSDLAASLDGEPRQRDAESGSYQGVRGRSRTTFSAGASGHTGYGIGEREWFFGDWGRDAGGTWETGPPRAYHDRHNDTEYARSLSGSASSSIDRVAVCANPWRMNPDRYGNPDTRCGLVHSGYTLYDNRSGAYLVVCPRESPDYQQWYVDNTRYRKKKDYRTIMANGDALGHTRGWISGPTFRVQVTRSNLSWRLS